MYSQEGLQFSLSLLWFYAELAIVWAMSCLALHLVSFGHYCHFFVPVWTLNARFVSPSLPFFRVIFPTGSLFILFTACGFITL